MFVVGCSISLWVKLHFPNDQLDADFGRQAMQGVPTPAAVPPRVVIDRPLRASRRKELESPEPIDMKPIPPAIPPGNAAREAALPADPSPAVVPQRHSAPAANGDISVAMIKSNHLPQDRPLKLVIGVPTVPRKKGDYLDMTLDALLDSLPDDPAHPWYDQVLIYVLSTAEVHASYDAARARLSVLPKGRCGARLSLSRSHTHACTVSLRYVKFVQAPTTQQDAGRPGGKNVKGMPTAKVCVCV